ncbi:hypothetical protein D3C77_684310 [compost metagenome]
MSTCLPACVSACARALSGVSRPVSWYLPIRATVGKCMDAGESKRRDPKVKIYPEWAD